MDGALSSDEANSTSEPEDLSAVNFPVWKEWYIYVLVISLLFILCTLIGNILTVVAFVKNESLKTPTNYLICSQSAADVLVGSSGILFVFFNYVPKGIEIVTNSKAACLFKLWAIQFSLFSNMVSVFALSLERLLFVVAPHGSQNKQMKMKVVRISIGLMWASNFILTIPPLLGWHTWRPGQRCIVDTAYPRALRKAVLIFFCMFILSMAIVNISLLWAFRKQRLKVETMSLSVLNGSDGGHVPNHQLARHQMSRRVTKMILLLVLIFYACWLPLLSMVIVEMVDVDFYLANPIFEVVDEFTKPLLLLNSALNPLIYAHRNSHFKKAFTQMLKCS